MKEYRQIIDNIPEFLDIFDLKLDKDSKQEEKEGIYYNILRNQEKVGRIGILYDGTNSITAKYEDIELEARYISFQDKINHIIFNIKKDDEKSYMGNLRFDENRICTPEIYIKSGRKECKIILNKGYRMLEFEAESMNPGIYKEEVMVHALYGIKQDIEGPIYKYTAYTEIKSELAKYAEISSANKFKITVSETSTKSESRDMYSYNFPEYANFDEKMRILGKRLAAVNPKYYETISKLREELTIGKTKILDKLISKLFSSISKETLKAIFGYDAYSNNDQNKKGKSKKKIKKLNSNV